MNRTIERNAMIAEKVLSRIPSELHDALPSQRLVSAYIHDCLAGFVPKIHLRQENSRYIVKTAENPEEVRRALILRHGIFYLENLRRANPFGLDVDRFDFDCDHLIIIEKEHFKVVGTYRLNPSKFNREFYSATEFSIKELLALDGHKLEIGRSCVHRNFRNSMVLAMLWRGMVEYLKLSDSRYLFGCTSLMTVDVEKIAAVYKHLQDKNSIDSTLQVTPKPKYRVKNLDRYCRFLETLPETLRPNAEAIMPSLLKSYIRAGALICGEPALDSHFNCVDFFTLLDFDSVQNQYGKKFSGD